MFRRLSFDTKPHIELLEKGTPLWPKYWARTTVMTTAYGHGIAVTPLHLANAYASLVNGGIWRPATLLKVPPGHAVKGRRVLKPSTSYRMRQLRSEEHTSELQSLMRISYAVFCLKKKKQK